MKISKPNIFSSLLVTMFTLIVSDTVYGNEILFPDTVENMQSVLDQGARKDFGGTVYEWEDGHVYIVTDEAKSRGRGDLADITAAIAPKMGIRILCETSDKAKSKTNFVLDHIARDRLRKFSETVELYFSESNFEVSVYAAQVDSNCDTKAIFSAVYDKLLKSGLKKEQVSIEERALKHRESKKMDQQLTENTAIVIITRLN